jgi:hypothetical protein
MMLLCPEKGIKSNLHDKGTAYVAWSSLALKRMFSFSQLRENYSRIFAKIYDKEKKFSGNLAFLEN